MEQIKEAAEALIAKVKSAGAAGVHGTFVAELKELAAKLEEALKD